MAEGGADAVDDEVESVLEGAGGKLGDLRGRKKVFLASIVGTQILLTQIIWDHTVRR
jgi:hypothetical protein